MLLFHYNFSALDNPYFIEWQKLARAPKRLTDYRLRTSILPGITAEVEDRQESQIKAFKNWTLCLDGWTDVSKNSIYSVLLTSQLEQHYIGNCKLAFLRHSSENILRAITDILGDKIKLVRAVVTDSPNPMVLFRSEFCKKNTNVYDLGCVLHSMNLICKDIIKSDVVWPIA